MQLGRLQTCAEGAHAAMLGCAVRPQRSAHTRAAALHVGVESGPRLSSFSVLTIPRSCEGEHLPEAPASGGSESCGGAASVHAHNTTFTTCTLETLTTTDSAKNMRSKAPAAFLSQARFSFMIMSSRLTRRSPCSWRWSGFRRGEVAVGELLNQVSYFLYTSVRRVRNRYARMRCLAAAALWLDTDISCF